MGDYRSALLCATSIALTMPGTAMSQQAAAASQGPQSSESGIVLAEIVVTAERRESNLQDAPVSVDVYGGDELRERGIFDLQALTKIDPSVNLAPSAGRPVLSIRGISSNNATETGEPAVSVAADGAFNNRSYSLLSSLYDIERIEVLRGPQGTLFGRNTTGGLLNVLSNRPVAESAGRITVDFGNYATKNFDGFFNVPITDTLQARASFASRQHDGFRNNQPFDQRGDDENTDSYRLQLNWDPSENLNIWVLAQRTKQGGVGPANEAIPFLYPAGTVLNPVTLAPAPGTEPLHTRPPLSDGRNYTIYGAASIDVDTWDYRLAVTYDGLPNDLTLSFLSAYNQIEYVRPGPNFFRNNPVLFTIREKPDTYNNELRLSSPDEGRFTWQVGVYSFMERNGLLTDLVRNPGSATATQLYEFDTPRADSDSIAVFGQATFDVTDQLSLTAGARQTWDEKHRRGTFRIRPAFTGAPVTVAVTQDGDAESDELTYLAGIDFAVTPDNLLYAKVSTGYKAGGFTGTSQYAPETVTAYEVGSKNTFLDRSLRLNLAAYYTDFKDQQVNQYVTVGGVSQAFVVNAGKSEIYGLEANVTALVEPLGTFDLALNLMHASYEEFLAAAGWSAPPAVVVNLDLAGNRPPGSPEVAASLRWEREFENVFGGALTTQVAGKYQSTVYFGPTNYPNQRQDGYALVDAQATYRPDEGNWSVQLYANNLFNRKYVSYSDEIYPLQTYVFSYGAPRVYGARLSYEF